MRTWRSLFHRLMFPRRWLLASCANVRPGLRLAMLLARRWRGGGFVSVFPQPRPRLSTNTRLQVWFAKKKPGRSMEEIPVSPRAGVFQEQGWGFQGNQSSFPISENPSPSRNCCHVTWEEAVNSNIVNKCKEVNLSKD